jgi:hypothetical protein
MNYFTLKDGALEYYPSITTHADGSLNLHYMKPTLDEIKQQKRDLEKRINELLVEFVKTTDCTVSKIEVRVKKTEVRGQTLVQAEAEVIVNV